MLPTKIGSEKHEQYFAPLRETIKKILAKTISW